MAIIQADPDKDRIDKIITRWLKRHLQRLGAGIDLTELNSLMEDRDMLAENLENWAKKERQEGEQLGTEKTKRATARNLIKLGVLSDEQIAEATGLTVAEVRALHAEDPH
ncbi:hypothetical protein [Halomonas sp. PR-M31]|uniref:hypothetical protein n=1 Tax=Halomonas sp. PR-M31 TaxID=1471202 RepID=UPI00065126FD|nr:hypothetical protein [Halomonas sp. PR-M31]